MNEFITKKKLYIENLNCKIEELKQYIDNLNEEQKTILNYYFVLTTENYFTKEELKENYNLHLDDYINFFTEKEISKRLHIPLESVKENLQKGLKAIRNKVPVFDNAAKTSYKIEEFFNTIEDREEINIVELEALENTIKLYILDYKIQQKIFKEIQTKLSFLKIEINNNRYDKKRERELLEDYKINHNPKALEELIKMHDGFIRKVANKYKGKSFDYDDNYQETVIGFIEGVNRFDLTKETNLVTYAYSWMLQRLGRAIKTIDKAIRIPVHMEDKIFKIKKTAAKLSLDLNNEQDLMYLAQELNLTEKQIKNALEYAALSPISLSTKINGKDKQDTELQELLADNIHKTVEEEAIDNVQRQEILKFLEKLSPKEKFIIVKRYGLEDGRARTLNEVGDMLGVTRERVRQIEAKVLRKLRHPAKRRYLKNEDNLIINVNETKVKKLNQYFGVDIVFIRHLINKKYSELLPLFQKIWGENLKQEAKLSIINNFEEKFVSIEQDIKIYKNLYYDTKSLEAITVALDFPELFDLYQFNKLKNFKSLFGNSKYPNVKITNLLYYDIKTDTFNLKDIFTKKIANNFYFLVRELRKNYCVYYPSMKDTKDSFSFYDMCNEYKKSLINKTIENLSEVDKKILKKYFPNKYSDRISLKYLSNEDIKELKSFIRRFKKILVKQQKIEEQEFNLFDRYSQYEKEYIIWAANHSKKRRKNLVKFFKENFEQKIYMQNYNAKDKKQLYSLLSNFKKFLENNYEKYQRGELNEVIKGQKTTKEIKYNLFELYSEYEPEYIILIANKEKRRKSNLIHFFGEDYNRTIYRKDLNEEDKKTINQILYRFKKILENNYEKYQRGELKKVVKEPKIRKEIKYNLFELNKEYEPEYIILMANKDKRRKATLTHYFGKDYNKAIYRKDLSEEEKSKLSNTLYRFKKVLEKNYDNYKKTKLVLNDKKIVKKIDENKTLYKVIQKTVIDYIFSKEIIDYALDKLNEKQINIIKLVWTEDYKNSSQIIKEKIDQNYYNLIHKIRQFLIEAYQNCKDVNNLKELKDSYDYVSRDKRKDGNNKAVKTKTIKDMLLEIDNSYDYHDEIIKLIINKELTTSEKANLRSMMKFLVTKIKPLYNQANNPNDIEEIRRLYEKKYKVISVEKIKKIDNYEKTIENLLLKSPLAKELSKQMPPIKVYATLLSQPIFIGKELTISAIASVLEITREEVCLYAKEGLQIINDFIKITENKIEEYEQKQLLIRNISSEN